MTRTELSKIATIRTGFTLRDKIPPGQSGDVSVIQPKDIVNGVLERPSSISSSTFKNLENHFLREGDILVSNKGVRFTIYQYRHHQSSHIASSSFFIVSPKDTVLPTYLEWYLTRPVILEGLQACLTGSIIPTLTKKDLENIKVQLPSISAQVKIARLIEVASEEIEVLRQLIDKKLEFRDSYCWELINS